MLSATRAPSKTPSCTFSFHRLELPEVGNLSKQCIWTRSSACICLQRHKNCLPVCFFDTCMFYLAAIVVARVQEKWKCSSAAPCRSSQASAQSHLGESGRVCGHCVSRHVRHHRCCGSAASWCATLCSSADESPDLDLKNALHTNTEHCLCFLRTKTATGHILAQVCGVGG